MKEELYDLETDSVNPEKANLKFYGGIDCDTGKVTILPYTKNVQIADRIKQAKILIGFNIKNYDNKILERNGINTDFKTQIDLYQCLAPNNYNSTKNKNRLADINPSLKLKNYKLKTIIEALGLDDEGSKGKIDYEIFKKDEWTPQEQLIIQKYLKQDLILSKKLFDWYKGIFQPLEKYLNPKDVERCKHLTCKSGGVGYKFLCHQAGLKEKYRDWDEAHKIKKRAVNELNPYWEAVKNIVEGRLPTRRWRFA